MLKWLKHTVVLLAGSALLGTLLLVLVFLIPTDRIREHVRVSSDKMMVTGENETDAFRRYVLQNRESYTDSIIMQYTFETIEGKSAYEHAMWNYHYDIEEEIWAAEESLQAVLAGESPENMHLREYSRYWHGYLIFIKPLMLLFNWDQLAWQCFGLLIFLLLFTFYALYSQKLSGVAAAMVCGLFFMKPVLMTASFTMSVCFYITLIAMLFLVKKGKYLDEKKWFPEFFLCVGILTAYFDFLTYPAVTLGFPLCLLFYSSRREKLWIEIKRLISYCVSWGIGYAGMWASKWIIADITLHTGTIRDAVWNVIGRTEAIGGRPRMNGGFYVIGLNFQEYEFAIYKYAVVALAILVAAALVSALLCRVPVKELAETAIPFIIIGIIPFAWIVVVQHHSALHARFTFRILGVAAFAMACLAFKMLELAKVAKKSKNKL